LKPWKKFRKRIVVLAFSAKNTSGKVPFLLFRFLWASKENEINLFSKKHESKHSH